MGKFKFVVLTAGVLAATLPAFSLPASQGRGRAVVTVMDKKHSEAALNIQEQDLNLKINGKEASITGWTHMTASNGPLEFVLLIDGSARSSFGTQISEVDALMRQLPAGTKAAIAYMENGRAAFSGPLSTDPTQTLKAFHLPAGMPGQNGSPYFCLSDLAQHWPSNDPIARREVMMITDGIDTYNPRFDPEDPYVLAAIKDVVQAGMVVYSVYWTDVGRMDNSMYLSSGGQNLLQMVSDATGGMNYWNGVGNPVSFEPFFKDMLTRFDHQYRVGFSAELKGKAEVDTFKLHVGHTTAHVTAPEQVLVVPPAS